VGRVVLGTGQQPSECRTLGWRQPDVHAEKRAWNRLIWIITGQNALISQIPVLCYQEVRTDWYSISRNVSVIEKHCVPRGTGVEFLAELLDVSGESRYLLIHFITNVFCWLIILLIINRASHEETIWNLISCVPVCSLDVSMHPQVSAKAHLDTGFLAFIPSPSKRWDGSQVATARFSWVPKTNKRNKLRGFSPQANYTNRATAACRQSYGRAGNWTQNFWICSQELWPLVHRGGLYEALPT
jgi:hypothetical protein